MTISERITSIEAHRRLHDNVVRLDDERERRAPQKWWERAQAGALYGTDENGRPVAGKAYDRWGGDAA